MRLKNLRFFNPNYLLTLLSLNVNCAKVIMHMKNKKAYNIKNTSPVKPGNRKLLWWLLGLVLVAGIGFAIYKYTRPDKKPIEVIQSTSQLTPQSGHYDSEASSSNSDKSTVSTTNNSTIVNLAVPSGTFVSSHHVSLSDTGVIASTCNTTPGAKCSISFTDKNGEVRYLPEATADKKGTAYWTWTAKGAKLTTGNWKISATAKAGSQSKTATDPQQLEVSP